MSRQMMTLQDFTNIEKIGEGTFSVVYKAKCKKTGKLVAMKRIRFEPEDEGIPVTAIREISILNDLQHPNIISLQNVILEEKKLYLIFELLSMDLKKYLDQIKAGDFMDPQLVKSYLYQINDAILFCHQKCVLHRDLKPQNLLISRNGIIKVGDFGLGRAIIVPKRVHTPEIVTLWYRAPEVLLGANRYSCSIDIWSLGCIFAEMATRKPLFHGSSEISQLFKIFKILGTPTEDIWPGVSDLTNYQPIFPKWNNKCIKENVENMDDVAIDLLKQMLIYDPVKRISAKEIAVHPYFNNLDRSVKPVF